VGFRQVLFDAAKKIGVEGAEELLGDLNKGVDEVYQSIQWFLYDLLRLAFTILTTIMNNIPLETRHLDHTINSY
jgi:hypothetical protein